jgi:putative ABC transport system substrate-binding protein
VLWPVSEAAPELQAFRQGLRELGYLEGQNVALEYRYARGRDELLPGFAAELAGMGVDVIVTWGVVAARAAKQATQVIPIVNGSMSDPVRAGLVASLARPGGNLTGLTSATPDLSAKRLELMKEVLPSISRLAVLATPNPTAMFGLKETEQAARKRGIALQSAVVREAGELESAYAAMIRERAEGVIVLADLIFIQHLKRLVALADEHRLPAVYFSEDYVGAGGLMSYSASFADMFRRAAVYVDRILKGAKPADLPVEQPTKFDLVVNLKTAKALGLKVPQSVLLRADRVIE